MGITAPAAKPTVADEGSAGNPDGTYNYVYTYADNQGTESSASPASDDVIVVANKINVDVLESNNPRVTHINIYRNGGTLDDWYYVDQIDNSSQTFTDNIADSDLATLYDADNNDPPPDLYHLIEHYERGIGVRTDQDPNSIWWTEEYEMEYWGASSQYLLGGNDEITGLLSWGRLIPVWKKHEIYVMEGVDPSSWHKRRANSRKGNIAPAALDFWKMPIFCSYDGLYFFDGDTSIPFSNTIETFFTKDTNKNKLPDAVGIVHDNKYYFGLSDVTLVYDLLFKKFYTYDFGVTALCYDHINNFLYGGVDSNVVKLEQNNNPDSENVNFKIKSKAYKLNETDGLIGELKNYVIDINTRNENVTFNIYVDNTLKQSLTLNNNSGNNISRLTGNFNAPDMKGTYAEFEFAYTGTKQIQIDMPLTINGLPE